MINPAVIVPNFAPGPAGRFVCQNIYIKKHKYKYSTLSCLIANGCGMPTRGYGVTDKWYKGSWGDPPTTREAIGGSSQLDTYRDKENHINNVVVDISDIIHHPTSSGSDRYLKTVDTHSGNFAVATGYGTSNYLYSPSSIGRVFGAFAGIYNTGNMIWGQVGPTGKLNKWYNSGGTAPVFTNEYAWGPNYPGSHSGVTYSYGGSWPNYQYYQFSLHYHRTATNAIENSNLFNIVNEIHKF